MASRFSWIPFYNQLTQRLLEFESRQNELILILEEMRSAGLPVMFLDEDLPDETRARLNILDPFSFVMNLHITSESNTLRECEWLQKRLEIQAPLPADLQGLPTFMPRAPWFFAALGDGRQPDDVPALWQLAKAARRLDAEQLDAELFHRCRQIKGVGLSKLTTGLYWFNPDKFLSLAGPVLPFLQTHGVTWNKAKLQSGSLGEYRSVIKQAREITPDFPALVFQAWQWSKGHAVEATVPVAELPPFALNTILYGPPGTGKTYEALARAVQIIDGESPAERAECMARFAQLRAAGQIGFVTFHQSFSYEEFVEGLRPVVDDESGAHYAVRDGIFKALALRALGACLEPAQPGRSTFDELWSAFCHALETNPEETYLGLAPGTRFEIEVTSSGNLRGRNAKTRKTGTRYLCSRGQVEAVWRQFQDAPEVDSAQVKSAVASVHAQLIAVVFRELKHLESIRAPRHERDFHPEEAASSLLDGGGDYRCRTSSAPRFVLIVDEINRGNISRIFGELITLLESDKRLNTLNEIRVTLPYSNKSFALPPNLYLIGTMNTADKSLALLDIALRRRFDFEEIAPNFARCPMPESMTRVLQELNLRLLQMLDREHRIGHAFFMEVQTQSDFNAVFARKIVPLLQEYFYNDWEALRMVLGEATAGETSWSEVAAHTPTGALVVEIPAIAGVRGRNRFAWWHDLGLPTPNFLAVLCQNYGIASDRT